MAKAAILQVQATILDTQLHQWCEHCLLPSGYVMQVATEYGGSAWEVLTLKGCGECGAQAPLH